MEVSPALVKFVSNEEGPGPVKVVNGNKVHLPYICAAGKPTIGYGRVIPRAEFNRLKKTGISPEEAYNNLLADLSRFSRGLIPLVKVHLSQNQFDALVSLAYNIGLSNFRNSTLLRLLNKGDYAGASKQFERWNRGGGKVLGGLVRRRGRERAIFLFGVYA